MKKKMIAMMASGLVALAMVGCSSDNSSATREGDKPNPVVKAPTSAAEASGGNAMPDKAKDMLSKVAPGAGK